MNIDDLTCKLCNRECTSVNSLGCHVVKQHKMSSKEYYDFYILKSPVLCKVCGGATSYKSLSRGYNHVCSIKCACKLMASNESQEKKRNTCLEKYGTEYSSQHESIRKKISLTQTNRMQDPREREKISVSTKLAMNTPEVRDKFLMAVRAEKSDETIQKMKACAIKRSNDPEIRKKIYTEDRNKKISNSKIEYWKNNPDQKQRVGNIWKLWKARDEVGWRRHLLTASKKGFEKIFSPTGNTTLELYLYSMLENENIKFVKQYELENKLYDAYLPEFNVLIEIDGEFWHPLFNDDCKYLFQTESFLNDKLKNSIAEKNKIKLIRIRESSILPTIRELL